MIPLRLCTFTFDLEAQGYFSSQSKILKAGHLLEEFNGQPEVHGPWAVGVARGNVKVKPVPIISADLGAQSELCMKT